MGQDFSKTTVIGGTFDKEYESVRDLFKKNFETGREEDAQLCVYVEGRKVVDLWGSAVGDTTYTGDSLQCVFSSSKAITAIALASIADQGLFEYDHHIARYIPEFAEGGKKDVKIEDLLRHESGLANLHTAIHAQDLFQDGLRERRVVEIIGKNAQSFPDNTPREYHNLTAGWIMNEIVRKVTPENTTLGAYIRREFYDNHGIDVHMGLKEDELARVRPLVALTQTKAILHSLIPTALGAQVEHNALVFGKILNSFRKRFLEVEKRGFAPMFHGVDPKADPGESIPEFFNGSAWRSGESPHGNVHASGRALAKLASAMAQGGEHGGKAVLSPAAWDKLHLNPVVRPDAYMSGCRTEFTQGGVNVFRAYEDDRMGERILKSGRDGYIGWMGFGGSVMQWHPELKIGFGYACTLLTWWDLANTKARKLQKEVALCTTNLKQPVVASTTDENNNNTANA